MITEVKTDEDGRVYIPLPDETREAITLELLIRDYRILGETEGLDSEETEQTFKQAFETLIHYYGGNLND